MAYPYITEAQLRNRLGSEVVDRLLDDDDDGDADTGPLTQLIADASSRVAGKLRGAYSLDAVAANTPAEVVRLTLDVAVAYAAQRHPEAVRRDWQPLWEASCRELNELRTGKSSLDVETTPEPGELHGGDVYSGDPDDPEPDSRPHTFLNGTGGF